MRKPSDNPLRELFDLAITILLFLALVAVFWLYVVASGIVALYRFIVRRP